MNLTRKIIGASVALILVQAAGLRAQTTEVTANLLSVIQRQSGGGSSDTFQVSFGSLNGGLASLLTKDSSADGASGFATWYGNNSRTLLNWGTVQGSAITDSDSFYRYYGANTALPTYQGSALTSIYSNTLDNRALAFVTYSDGSTVQEIGLYDLGFNWGNPSDTGSYPFGVYDYITLGADAPVTAVYGVADASTGTYGTLSTSTVPEPSSAALLLLGTMGILALRRFRAINA